MPFRPEKIIELTKHPKAYEVLKARADGQKRWEILNFQNLTADEYEQITRQRSFRAYLKRYKDEQAAHLLAEADNKELDPQDLKDVRKQFDRYAPEALHKLIIVMRNSQSMKDQKEAACEILDRAGYVKVQKQISVHADAEAIIRELNKQNQAELEKPKTIEVEATEVTTEALDDESTDALEEALKVKEGNG